MPHIDGETLRAWRRSRGWDVPETGRRLGHAAADGQVPVHDAPVLELPPELRIQTVTGYLDEIGEMLAAPRFDASALGVGLRQQISEFNASPV
jgi:hypothetical protein